MPQAQGEPSQYAYYPTPGLRLLGALPKGPVRGIKQVTTGGVYAVGGDTVYLVNADWTSTALGTITPLRPYPVSMQDNGNTLMIVDGTTGGWTVDLASNAFAAITDPAFYGADKVDYLDTYFILNKPKTPQFYISGSLAVTWDSLDFANKESFSDLLVTIAVAKREIWLLGDRTTEVWYNQGLSSAADFTFAQIQGTFVDQGCCAKYSVATYDDAVYWLAANRAGQGIVLTGAGYQTKRISTFAIENELTTYPRIDDAVGFTYLLAGHIFYVLTFPAADKTWVYDIATQQWHEWLWIDDNGEEHRHRANCAYFIDGTVVMGDHENGNLYAVENTALTDNGQPIKRQRSYPHIVNELKRVYYRQFIADIESGNPIVTEAGTQTLLSCSFTATDGTLLEDYSSTADTNAVWTLVSGTSGKIEGGRFVGATGGSDLYQSPTLSSANYTLQFRAIPTGYAGVGTSSVFAIARSTGAGTGYRAAVYGDGSQYWVSLGVEGGSSTSLAMGTVPSGWYVVTLALQSARITLTVQRNSDGLYLQSSGLWGAAAVPAMTLSDATYTAAGTVMIGGTWTIPPPTLSSTMETSLAADPNFPSGYGYQNAYKQQAFDFTRNWYYHPISGTVAGASVGGIAITDLSTMEVVRTVTMDQMYAGTPYGLPPGSPPTQSIFLCSCGNGTDLYITTASDASYSPAAEFTRFTRVDPVSMKVTGEFYISRSFPPPITCVMSSGWQSAMVNTTATHTIVLYPINGALTAGPEIFDGTGMVPIGLGPTPMTQAYNCMFCAGKKHTDGSCDFIMMDPDSWLHPTSGNIDIWRINVSDSLVITSTKTGTLNVLPYFTPPSTTNRLLVGQLEYDPVHDTMIVTLPDAGAGTSTPNAAPSWLLSMNYNGSVNWSQHQATIGGSVYSNSQSDLANGTYMAGSSTNLHLYDTGTGAITWTGSIAVLGSDAGSFFNVWDSTRNSYWTYALSRGFVRIDMHAVPSLAMDNLLVSAPVVPEGNQIFLSWSDDRGHSFGSPVGQPIGATGKYLTNVQWQRLAYARDRVFKLEWSVPVATALQGAFIEVDTNAKS